MILHTKPSNKIYLLKLLLVITPDMLSNEFNLFYEPILILLSVNDLQCPGFVRRERKNKYFCEFLRGNDRVWGLAWNNLVNSHCWPSQRNKLNFLFLQVYHRATSSYDNSCLLFAWFEKVCVVLIRENSGNITNSELFHGRNSFHGREISGTDHLLAQRICKYRQGVLPVISFIHVAL